MEFQYIWALFIVLPVGIANIIAVFWYLPEIKVLNIASAAFCMFTGLYMLNKYDKKREWARMQSDHRDSRGRFSNADIEP